MRLINKIRLWFIEKNIYHNPFYHWWKVKKYFVMPKFYFVCGKYSGYGGLPVWNHYSIINFYCRSLYWDDKFNLPYYKASPIVCFIFKNPITYKKYWVGLILKYSDSFEKNMMFNDIAEVISWETILNVLYYNKTIDEAIELNSWSIFDKNCEKVEYKIDAKNILRKKRL